MGVGLDPCVADTHCLVLYIVAVLVGQNGDVGAACLLQSVLEALTAVSGVLEACGAGKVQNLCALLQMLCHVLALHMTCVIVLRTYESEVTGVCLDAETDNRRALAVGRGDRRSDGVRVSRYEDERVNALCEERVGLVDLLLVVVVAVREGYRVAGAFELGGQCALARHAEYVGICEVYIADVHAVTACGVAAVGAAAACAAAGECQCRESRYHCHCADSLPDFHNVFLLFVFLFFLLLFYYPVQPCRRTGLHSFPWLSEPSLRSSW